MRAALLLLLTLPLPACAFGELLGGYELPATPPQVTGSFPKLSDSVEDAPMPLTEAEINALTAEIEAIKR